MIWTLADPPGTTNCYEMMILKTTVICERTRRMGNVYSHVIHTRTLYKYIVVRIFKTPKETVRVRYIWFRRQFNEKALKTEEENAVCVFILLKST